jgi:hypothetical protein
MLTFKWHFVTICMVRRVGLVIIMLGLNSGDSGSDLDVVHETKVSRALAVFSDCVLHWPTAPSAVGEFMFYQ